MAQLDVRPIGARMVRVRDEFVRSFSTLNEMKYEPKLDYRRKRGLVEEINRSLLSVEQDLDIIRGMSQRQVVEPGVIDYAPSTIDSPDAPPPPPPAAAKGK